MIKIKTKEEIDTMRQGGKILAHVLVDLAARVKPGVKLAELDRLAEQLISEAGAKPSFKGYQPDFATRPYPASVCLSLNSEVVHGLPAERVLEEGDLLKIDLGVFYKGFHTDSAITVGVGKISKDAEKLIRVTEQSLHNALDLIKPGVSLGDIGYAIGSFVKEHNFSIIKELTGHGIGREIHEEPNIFNFGQKGKGQKLEEGMTLAIEPMVSLGKGSVVLAEDGFTYKTVEGSLAAHFEHTVAVTKDGVHILTEI